MSPEVVLFDHINCLSQCRLFGGKPERIDVRPKRRSWPQAAGGCLLPPLPGEKLTFGEPAKVTRVIRSNISLIREKSATQMHWRR
jgi:hypothetical protein